MSRAPLLLEIGCEEIPARMIRAAGEELSLRVCAIVEQAGLDHGDVTVWSGPRRIAVRIEDVVGAQEDREELVLGPPVSAAFAADGTPTAAALGFAKKQGIEATDLARHATERGEYAGFVRRVSGRGVGPILAEHLPRAVEGMSFPKTMRWGEGRWRWVRPVHWVLALHGPATLDIELFGVASSRRSLGHRFLSDGPAEVDHPDTYLAALESAYVVADPARRRRVLRAAMERAADERGGRLVEDEALLSEVADLVE